MKTLENRQFDTQEFELLSEPELPQKDISCLTAEFRGVAERSPLERSVRLYVSETLAGFQDKAKNTLSDPSHQEHQGVSKTTWKPRNET